MKKLAFFTSLVLISSLGLYFLFAANKHIPDFQETKTLAEQGDSQAQYNLGMMYYDGQEVEQDYFEAVKWMRLAAEQGDANAQFNLGTMYFNGEGVKQNKFEAIKWYRLAAEQGVAQAKNNLGWMYESGEGVKQDKVKAKEWYGKACDNRYENGCKAYKELNEAGY